LSRLSFPDLTGVQFSKEEVPRLQGDGVRASQGDDKTRVNGQSLKGQAEGEL